MGVVGEKEGLAGSGKGDSQGTGKRENQGARPALPAASPLRAPLHVNILTPLSAAIAFASSVLPVPGAPASSTPPILRESE